MEENRKENMPNINTPSMRVTSTPQSAMWDRTSFLALDTSATPSVLDRSNLRPLTQSYKGAQADYEVLDSLSKSIKCQFTQGFRIIYR